MREDRLQAMAGPLLAWYDENKRDLPWRGTGDPYKVWVSEIMLQQTRVAAVMPYYQRWMEELPTVEALAAVDLEALRAYNPEVAGWIEIPDTGISYPLMQGANNQWYLKHTWTGEPSSVGAIFMDSRNSRDLGDFHTIVYGHRLRSGAMFAPLRFYEDDAYRQEHPSVYIADDAGLHRYDIFAVYAADVKDRVYQELDVEDEETRQAFIRFCLDSALADTGVTPEAGDRILTLSTCTGDGYAQRWVVQAVLRPEAEEGPEEGGGAG